MSLGALEYRIAEGVLAQSLGDSVVLFHPETERLLTLNACGSRIWALLSEAPDLARIITRLTEEYEGPETVIRQEVLEFMSQLQGERIVRRGE